MASYRLVGTRSAPRAGRVVGLKVVPAARNKNASITTEFRVGNGSSALAVTNADRTLGSSNYRLRPDRAERLAHGCRPTKNDATFVASGERVPMRNVQPGKNGYREMTERTAVQ